MIDDIKAALEVLQKGGVILYPTDTIWGLGCDAANEEAVAAFLDVEIAWVDIAAVCAAVLDRYDGAAAESVEAVVEADGRARSAARSVMRMRFLKLLTI